MKLFDLKWSKAFIIIAIEASVNLFDEYQNKYVSTTKKVINND